MPVPGRKTIAEITHNTKIRHYPDGTQKVTYCSSPVFREPGYEELGPIGCKSMEKRTYDTSSPSRSDNLKRARESVFDIAALNPFEFFLTITIAPDNLRGVDRNDPVQVRRYVTRWLNNQVQRIPGFRYLLLPEHHKDGAIHAHALVSGIRVEDSGTVTVPGCKQPMRLDTAMKKGIAPEDCHTVYNVPGWKLGYSTAIALYGDSARVANYVVKYITKESGKIFGHYYLAGGKGLVRKPPVTLMDVDFCSIEERAYLVREAGLSFKYRTIKVEGGDTDG